MQAGSLSLILGAARMSNTYALLLLLAGVSVGLFNLMKIIETKNNTRNLVVNVNKDGKDIPARYKRMMIENEFWPMTVGVNLYLLLFSVSFLCLPGVLYSDKVPFSWWTIPPCLLAAFLGFYAMYIDLTVSFEERKLMRNVVDQAEVSEADRHGDRI